MWQERSCIWRVAPVLARVGIVATVLVAAVVAGCAPQGSSVPVTPQGQTEQPDQVAAVGIVIREFAFEPQPLKVKAGTVRFKLMNRGAVEHDFAIPSLAGHNEHGRHLVRPGETKIIELDLKPGTYAAICTIPGHKEAGMVVTVEVGS